MVPSSRLSRASHSIHRKVNSRESSLLGGIINLIMPSNELSVLLRSKTTVINKLKGGHIINFITKILASAKQKVYYQVCFKKPNNLKT